MRMTPLSDFHIHSSFSSDSDAEPEDMIQSAIQMKLPSICFTDHNDFDYPLQDGNVVFLLDLPGYMKEICRLREIYREQIKILVGVEQGLQSQLADKIDHYDPTHQLDFIIGSSHLIHGEDPYYRSFWEGRCTHHAVLSYFESIYENIRTCHNYDVYGHLDYVIRYAPEQDKDYNWTSYSEIIDKILGALISRGKGIEVNTAGLKYGLKDTNPCKGILKRYRELGGELLTVGSDAHKPEHIAYDFNKAKEILSSCGFRYITVYEKRLPHFIKID
jgi:histidinol-phosphatase (PHP family)